MENNENIVYGQILNLAQIEEIKTRLKDEIELSSRSLLKQYPVEIYIKLLGRYPENAGYHYVSPEIKRYCEEILHKSDTHTLELYHQLILVELILKNKVDKQKFPEPIKQLFFKNFARISNNILLQHEEPGFYLYSNDKFCKDLAVCTGTMIPAGAQKVVVITLPKTFIIKKGPIQFIRGLGFILFKLQSLKPLVFDMHTDSHDPDLLSEHNFEGWKRFYKNIAQLLKNKPEVTGIYGASWLVDPKIEDVSPRHTYIRKLVTQNGGKLFYIGPTEHGKIDALTKSPTRRKLYAEGKYVPTDYMIIWDRRSLIKWADKLSDADRNL